MATIASFKHHFSCNRVTRSALRTARLAVYAQTADMGNAAPTVPGYQRAPELQAALDDLFADTIDKGIRRLPHAQVSHHLDRIAELGRQLGLDRVHPEWNDGAFYGLLTTLMSGGITTDSECTLARLTFGKVPPADLMVQTDQAAAAGVPNGPDQFKGPLARVAEGTDGYSVVTHFKILSNGVLGRMTVKALYSMDEQDPAKLRVTFLGFTLAPAFPDPHSLALWREALAEANPGMGEDGEIAIQLAQQPSSVLRYILMEPDLQLALGPSGSLTTMQRVVDYAG